MERLNGMTSLIYTSSTEELGWLELSIVYHIQWRIKGEGGGGPGDWSPSEPE